MAFKIVFLVLAVIAQEIAGQCIGTPINGFLPNVANGRLVAAENVLGLYGATPSYIPAAPLAYETLPGLNLASLAASGRGGVTVSSVSPFAPNGLRVQTDNMLIEGPLVVNGKLPFLGTAAMDGTLPTLGLGNIAYRCGSGNIGITNENYPPAPTVGYNPSALAPGSYGARAGSPAYATGRYGCNGLL